MLKDGDKAPGLELPSADMEMQTLEQYQGEHNVVLYFYPKDDTPGCTKEGLEFTDLMDEFEAEDTVVIGISKDSCISHAAFRDKYGLTIQLLADVEGQQVQAEGVHGETFHYKTINSDMLGWIISRVSGKAVTTLASERLWRPMGAEQDAYQTVDGLGVPFAGGGLTAGMRDLGRIGLLMLNGGTLNGQKLFPASVVEKIRKGGDRSKFGTGFPTLAGGSYTSQWWVLHNRHGAFAARGVHGQTIYVDPTAEMVLVRFASFPKAQNGLIDPTSLPAYQAVAEYLMSR